MNRSFLVTLSLLAIIISTASSINLQCKKWRKEICFNSNIVIKEKGMSIQPITNDPIAGIKTLFFKEAVVHVLPVNISEAFPNLEIIKIINSSLIEVEKLNFIGLEKVVEVNFERNLISSLSTDTFYFLENLSKINLNHNNISAIPPKLFTNNLKLTEISFINNRIEQLHDQTFKNLVNLKFIFLSDNNIEDLRGGTFDDCTELKIISISNNKLKYAPKTIFDQNKKLKFNKKNFIKNKCIDSALNVDRMETIDDLKNAFEENCKPYNQEYIDELNAKIKELEKSVEDLNTKLEKVTKNLESTEKKLKTKEEELKDLQAEKAKFDANLNEKNEKIRELDRKVDELTENSNDLSSSLSKCQSDLKIQESENSNIKSDLETCKIHRKNCEDNYELILKNIGSDQVKILKFEDIKINLTSEIEYLRSQVAEKDKIIAENSIKIQETDLELNIRQMTIKMIINGYKEANRTIEALSTKLSNLKALTPVADTDDSKFFNIDCKFEENSIRNDRFYSCGVNEIRAMDCSTKLKEITSNSNGKVVDGISFTDSYMIEFPIELAKKFENFKLLKISNSGFGKFVENVCELSNEIEALVVTSSIIGDSVKLDECKSLKTLQIESSGLKSIIAENPIKSLTNIALKGNKIEEISKDFFGKFENLKSVQMPENKISYLNGDIFDVNRLLETVNLSKNPIKKINGEIFTMNSKLISVDFKQLGCVNKAEYNKNKIGELRREVKAKCS